MSYDALSRIAKSLIGAYLPVPTIGLNYTQSKRWGSSIIWDRARLSTITGQEIVDTARALSRPSGQHLLLVLSHGLDEGLVRGNQIKELGIFDGAVVPDENFYLYQLD